MGKNIALSEMDASITIFVLNLDVEHAMLA